MPELSGVITALITPFIADGQIDQIALRHILEYQLQHDIGAICLGGSTGEGTSLANNELCLLLQITKAVLPATIPIIVGITDSLTMRVIQRAQAVAMAGADYLLIAPPYYNCPNQQNIMAHYQEISRNTDLPIIIYDIPKRTGVKIDFDTIMQLAELPNIYGIKDYNPNRSIKLQAYLGEKLRYFAGDDIMALGCYANGAKGVFSVLANLVPAKMVQLHDAWQNGKTALALHSAMQLVPLIEGILESDTNPIPIKYAMAHLKYCQNYLRLPLTALEQQKQNQIATMLDDYLPKLGVTLPDAANTY